MCRQFVGLILAAASVVCAAEESLPVAEAQSIIQKRVENGWNYGIAVGLIDDKGSQSFGYGKLSASSEQKIDGDTVFEIGSITKTFTATLLAEMATRGEVNLADPVSKYLPSGTKVPKKDGKQITLQHLAQHTSGLPRLPENLKPKDARNPFADYTAEEMYDFLKTYSLPRGIGEKYEYSNLGVGLLGHVLALKAGTNYEALVTSRICEPLDMNDTRIALTPGMRNRLAAGHNTAGTEVLAWDIPALAGCGALRSTANDLLKFLAANMELTETKLAAAVREAQSHRFKINDGMEIYLGWHVARKNGHEIVWHNGGTGGYRSFAGFIKETNRGVVVLTNTDYGVDDIGMHLLEKTCQLDPALSAARKVRNAIVLDPKIFDAYLGEYELQPGISITITKEGNNLMAQATGEPRFQIFPESETEFFYKIVDAQIVFVKNAAGGVTQFVLKRGGLKFEAKKKQ